jgi:peptidase E
MTKYILHGGRARIENKSNKRFFEEILNISNKEVTVLLLNFAKPKSKWPEYVKSEKKWFRKAARDKKVNFIIADTTNVVEQIKKSDVIYMAGGDGHLIKKELDKVPNLAKLFNGKTVAGSSAGTNVLAKYFFTNDYDRIEAGLGILPIKTICHIGKGNMYGKDYAKEIKQLEKYHPEFETIALKETEYKIILI